jgi:hypothetical protein
MSLGKSLLNGAATVSSDLYVAGKSLLNGATTISSDLYVSGKSLHIGATTVLSDLYVSGNTYFGASSIGSYLKIDDFNSNIENYYNKNGVNAIFRNYYTKAEIDAQEGLISVAVQSKLNISDFNSTMSTNFYTNTTCDSRFQKALQFSDSSVAGEPVILPLVNTVRKINVTSPLQMTSDINRIQFRVRYKRFRCFSKWWSR